MIEVYIKALVDYGVTTGLITEYDRCYIRNELLELFGLDAWTDVDPKEQTTMALSDILEGMLAYAYEQGILKEDGIVHRDLFDTKIMGLLVPRPGEVIQTFATKYQTSPNDATDYFYQLSQDSNYIRRDRIAKDQKWKVFTKYGELDITINLSKPEKDPKAIAQAKQLKQSGYPKCQLCMENEGYAGRIDHPARQNHRIIPITICGSQWGLQYSPYVYYNEHCIVFHGQHVPMTIDRSVFEKLFDFVRQFPHYMVGSNADLPIVGGSILTHEHFQGGCYDFPMARADIKESFQMVGYEDVSVGILNWPMSVIRLQSEHVEHLVDLADRMLLQWRDYTDEENFIYARTGEEPHNTITPIARKRGERYELDLVLRNNITTKEHPLGVFHPHQELHHIKKENIGLIEVMGLAVLPARLSVELQELKEALLAGENIREHRNLEKHADWVDDMLAKHGMIAAERMDDVLRQEVGEVFLQVLEHAGVFKQTEAGHKGFLKFLHQINDCDK